MNATVHALILVVASSAAAVQSEKVNVPRIPDAQTAVMIAEPKLIKIYGRKVIDSEKPLSAVLEGNVWIIRGSLWCDDGKGGRTHACVGGVAQMKLRQQDGKVLSVIHTK